jgi:hypothetical protein
MHPATEVLVWLMAHRNAVAVGASLRKAWVSTDALPRGLPLLGAEVRAYVMAPPADVHDEEVSSMTPRRVAQLRRTN